MIRRRTLMALVALAAALCLEPGTQASTATTALIAAPTQGHPRDVLYLSGGGFAPHQRVSLAMICAGSTGTRYFRGPTATARGSFVAFRMVAPALSGSRPVKCTIYATDTFKGKPLAVQTVADYTVVPTGQLLSRCARQMCVRARAVLVRTTRGVQGNIVVSAWPGAVASAAVRYPGGTMIYRSIQVGWRGTANVRLRIAKNLKPAMKVSVHVTAVLGPRTGTTTATFTVVPST